jgi:hypothetical protein
MGFCLLLVILLSGVSLIMAMARVGKDLVDPVAIAQAVKSIGFAGTPADYKVTRALAAPGVEIVFLERSSDLQNVYLLRSDRAAESDDLEDGRTLEKLTNWIFAKDGQKLSLSDVREKGKIEIKPGGAKLLYQMGSLTDPKSTVYSGMVGFVRTAKTLSSRQLNLVPIHLIRLQCWSFCNKWTGFNLKIAVILIRTLTGM